jgi:hypothetical protein
MCTIYIFVMYRRQHSAKFASESILPRLWQATNAQNERNKNASVVISNTSDFIAACRLIIH